MNKIIIADDDKVRRTKIIQLLNQEHDIPIKWIDECDSINSAVQLLKSTYYSIALIDMGLPKLSGGEPDNFGGVAIVESIYKNKVKSPGFILGCTAIIDNLEQRTAAFKAKGFRLEQSTAGDYSWLNNAKAEIKHFLNVFSNYERGNYNISVLTVHGIRSYASWQEDIERIIINNSESQTQTFFHYKHTLISTYSFLKSKKRDEILDHFTLELQLWINNNRSNKIICVAHSFGTFLLMEGIKRLNDNRLTNILDLIILCGSVLPEDYKFDFLSNNRDVHILNECAIHDYPLLFNGAIVKNSGLAGILGFKIFNGQKIKNRYFNGGHSLFFDETHIMKYWVPVFNDKERVIDINEGAHQNKFFKIILRLSQLIGKLVK